MNTSTIARTILLTFGTSSPLFAQVVTTTRHAAAQQQQPQQLVPMGPSALTLTASPEVLYWAGGNSTFVGWTVAYNPDTGTYSLVKPLFTAVPNDSTGNGNTHVVVETSTSGSSTFRRTELQANVGVSVATVKAATTLSTSTMAQTETFGGTMKVFAESSFPDSIVDLLGIQVTSLHADAQAVLQLPPAQRPQAWAAAGFGPLVAIGYGLRGGAGITVTFQHLDEFEGRNAFLSVKAAYGAVSGSASLSQTVQTALETNQVAIDGFLNGAPPGTTITVPTLAMLQNNAQATAWQQGMLNTAMTCKERVGLWLAPVSVVTGCPTVEFPVWDDMVLLGAANEATDALYGLSEASGWNRPYSLVNFLSSRYVPGSNDSYGNRLNTARLGCISAMVDLWQAVRAYTTGNNWSDPIARQAVLDRSSTLHGQTLTLYGALGQLDSMVNAMPPMTVTPLHQQDTGGPYWNWLPMELQLNNVGFVSSAVSLPTWMSATFLIDESTPVHNVCTGPNGRLTAFQVVSNVPATDPGSDGLRNIRVRFNANIWAANMDYLFNFRDEFGRPGSAYWNLNWY